MTAPAAPTILRRRAGAARITLRWLPVTDATDYKLYVGPTTNPSGLEADIADDDIGDDGWFEYSFLPDDTDSFMAVTALNVGAEESDPSNELRFTASGDGTSYGKAAPPKDPRNTSDPFGAL